MPLPDSNKALLRHPTDFLPARPTVPNFNFKAYGALDRGMNPIGGTGQSAHQAFKGVHSWLPSLFNLAGSYMGLPGVTGGGPFGRAPGFTHAGHGPTPLLEQAGQAARGMGGNAGGPDGLLNALNAYIASSQLGIPSVDLH
ncbi:MAG: hypothetical protein JWO89_3728 [Verrucomicrobiaceae bacterium]|nr:hypothetical protein [Verrucomicrobiaceae bacterium]